MAVSIRNRIEGTVTGIIRGNVLSEVDAETLAGLVASVITTRAVDEMSLKVGDKVLLLVEATDVNLDKP
ncbi:MAG: TOBE domain-containing protein [Deltaproteobacteria bacterium]|nr:TOBE domain-containing protein [Deltaproteobacteria bacterium]